MLLAPGLGRGALPALESGREGAAVGKSQAGADVVRDDRNADDAALAVEKR